LANVNHVTRAELKIHLGLSPSLGVANLQPISRRRLSILTGCSQDQLLWALPELGNRMLDGERFGLNGRSACPMCTRRHRGGTVRRYFAHHVHVCSRHRLWIGSASYEGRFLDVSPISAIVSAQARHRRLAYRYGAQDTEHAFLTAREAVQYVRDLPKSVDRALGILCPDRTRIFGDDPAFLAAIYPDTVALTVLLLSPYWRSLASNEDTRRRFYAEAGWRTRRDRRYWPKRNDTLHDWVQDLGEASRNGELRIWPASWVWPSSARTAAGGPTPRAED
jgi:hypothetical protein